MPNALTSPFKKMNKQISENISFGEEPLYSSADGTTEVLHPFSTATKVGEKNLIAENIHRQQKAYKNFWPYGEVSLYSSSTAKNNIALWPILCEEGVGVHVKSARELRWVFTHDLPSKKIVVNARDLSNQLIQKCIHKNITMTVKDIHQAERISVLAKALGKTAIIRLQFNLGLIRPEMSPNISERFSRLISFFTKKETNGHANDLLKTGTQILTLANIKLNGFHVYCDENQKTRCLEKYMAVLALLISKLSKAWHGYQPKELILQGRFFNFRPVTSTGFFCECKVFNIETFAQLLLAKFRNTLIREKVKLQGIALVISYDHAKTNSVSHLKPRHQEKLS